MSDETLSGTVEAVVTCTCEKCAGLKAGDFVASDSSLTGGGWGSAFEDDVLTGVSYIDALLYAMPASLTTWNTSTAAPLTRSVKFVSSLPSGFSASLSGQTSLSATKQSIVTALLDDFESVANIDFNVVSSSASGTADVSIVQSQLSSGVAGQGGYRYSYSYSGSEITSKSMYGFATFDDNQDLTGANGINLVLHELGHALSLKHPGNYNAGGGGTEGPYLSSAEDNNKYTMMSYTTHPGTGSDRDTLGLYDIAALQYRFGANMNARTGDTTYSSFGGRTTMSIWDAGGTDTLDFSDRSSALTIDLRAGGFSTISAADDLSIAYGATIENAKGGSANDVIYSNEANNTLQGGGGADTYRFIGAWGSDTIVDSGSNTIELSVAASDVALSRSGRNLVISRASTSGSITVQNFYDSTDGSARQAWTITANGAAISPDGVTTTTNTAPTATGVSGSIASGASVAASSLFSASDANGDTITQYEFWDGGSGSTSGYFSLSGVKQTAGAAIAVTASQLSGLTYVGGGAAGSETLWVRAYDSKNWGEWAQWSMTTTVANRTPVATVSGASVASGSSVAASSLLSVSDADGDAVTYYDFWDGGGASSSGYFSLSGVKQNAGQAITITASQLSSMYYVGGSAAGSESIWVRAYDGKGWGDWAQGAMTTTGGNSRPVASASNATVASGASSLASTLFSVSDANGDAITQYEFWDGNGSATSGYFSLSGTKQTANQAIAVTSSQLSSFSYVGGSAAGSEHVWVRAYDSKEWSDWAQWSMTTTGGNSRPVSVGASASVASGSSVAASSLFSVSDADGDAVTQYEFWDGGSGSTSGYFSLSGTKQTAGQAIAITSSQLSSLSYVGGSAAGSEHVWVRAYDSKEWGDWAQWTMTTSGGGNNRPVAAGVDTSVAANASVAASALFAIRDADGDTITQYEFWDGDGGASSGYFSLSGSKQTAGQALSVTSSQLSSLTYVGGSTASSEYAWVRAYDGKEWGDWGRWTMTTTGGNSRPLASGVSASVASGASVSASTLFSVSDADGDAITQYEFWDGGSASTSGYFSLSGMRQTAGQAISITSSQLSSLTFVGGVGNGAESVWVRAYDGSGWGEWAHWTMTTTGGNSAPVGRGVAASVALGASVSASSLFTSTDADGDAITQYEFWDGGGDSSSGYFSLSGARQSANQTISISSGQLSSLSYVGGSSAGVENLWVRLYDGKSWGEWSSPWQVTSASASNFYPTATGVSTSVASGASVSASALFSVSDANGDTITQYEFWDGYGATSSGYFSLSGTKQTANQAISVTSSQLSTLNYVGGSSAGSETVWVRAYDGKNWGDWADWTMTTTASASSGSGGGSGSALDALSNRRQDVWSLAS